MTVARWKPSVMTVLAAALLAATSALLLASPTGRAAPDAAPARAPAARYHCPMHPTMVSDRPGDCPICGMRLVPMDDEAHTDSQATGTPSSPHATEPTAGTPAGAPKTLIYRSTMNPSEISDQPGKDSMGMDMVPEEESKAPTGPQPVVDGRVSVQIPERRRQLIGVRTTIVERKPLSRTINTVGRVAYDETHLHQVSTKVGGWVEKLYANATGEFVKAGDPLLSIYSPELVTSAQEYLIALHAREALTAATLPSAKSNAEQLVASARRRLQLFDVSPQQVRALEATGSAPTTMTLYAPVSGHIVRRNVTQGQKIEPGMDLLDIADLSRVWVLADVYEYELPFVHVGQPATMTLSYGPGRTFAGAVTFVYPVVAETTRTVKVRLEFANPDLTLRPEMYADVTLRSDLGDALVIPDSAVISTGQRDLAFVDRGGGIFEPRELRIGARLTDTFEVLSGLDAGERVLVSGNFLVDSESKLKAALAEARGTPAAADLSH